VAEAIHDFLTNSLRLRGVTIQCSSMGAAIISFASALDRETVLGAPHHMEPYWLSFVPHDAGLNLHHLPLDRACWLMLVNFPLDGLNVRNITSAVSSFANLVHWHKSSNLAQQIMLVNVHTSARITFSIVVAAGDEPCGHCWSVTCYLLESNHISMSSDFWEGN
jgi:hypothetical protein